MPEDVTEPGLKVVYILGWGGSGSTIIDNVLGGLEGWASTGELHALWEGLADGRHLCGCGVPVNRCSFWRRVLNASFGEDPGGRPDPWELLRWQRETVRMRFIGRLLWTTARTNRSWPALDAYARTTGRLYRGIAEVTGARVVVDSSKLPSYAALLGTLPGVVPYVVHVVRDPRAVAYSWVRRDSRGPISSTVRWVVWNVAGEEMRRRYGNRRSIFVRYEDFATHPRATLGRVVEMVDEDPAGLPFIDKQVVELGANHTVSGNRSRFETGPVKVRLDQEWRKAQLPLHRAEATVLALPLLHRYGYALRVDGHRPGVPGGEEESSTGSSGGRGSRS